MINMNTQNTLRNGLTTNLTDIGVVKCLNIMFDNKILIYLGYRENFISFLFIKK